MTREQMVSRYTDLAKRKSELVLQSAISWRPELEQEERIIMQEMAVLETAIKLPVPEEDKVPEMVTIKQASARTGLPYDYLRKMCLQNRIVYIKIGKKYLVNMGKLITYLNAGEVEHEPV